LGDETEVVQLVYARQSLLAWDVPLDLKTDKGLICIFLIFLTEVSVYVNVFVCIRAHTHTLHVGYLDVSPA